MISLCMVSYTSSVPANAHEQAVFCDHLQSIINFPPTLENLHCALIFSLSLLPTIQVRVLMVQEVLCELCHLSL